MAVDKTIGVPVTSGLSSEIEKYRYDNKLGSTAEAMRELAKNQLERVKRLEGRVETEDNSAMAPIAENTKMHYMQMWTVNSFENYDLVRGDMQKDVKGGGALMDLVNKHRGTPAVITCSGPTFDESVPFLKKWKGLIICGPTQVQTLIEHGIRPQYMIAYDSAPDFKKFVQLAEAPKGYYEGIQLLTTPYMDPGFVHRWAEAGYPRKWFLTYTSRKKDPLAQEPPRTVKQWIDHHKPAAEHPMTMYVDDEFTTFFLRTSVRAYLKNPAMGERDVRAEGVQPLLWNGGCTPNESVVVANFLGCYPIFMMGNDLCYAEDGRQRAVTYHLNEKGVREAMVVEPDPRSVVMSDDGRATRMELLVYKNALFQILIQEDLQGQQVWECAPEGKWGIMGILPRITPERLIKTQGYGLERESWEDKQAKVAEYAKTHLQSGDPDANVTAS